MSESYGTTPSQREREKLVKKLGKGNVAIKFWIAKKEMLAQQLNLKQLETLCGRVLHIEECLSE